MACPPMRISTFVALLIPAVAAAQPRGTIIVTNKGPATATIVDVATNKVLATLPTGDGPHEVTVSRDGGTAVVTNYGGPTPGSSLTIIDMRQRTIRRTIDLGEYRRPHGVKFVAGDTLIAVTSETNRVLLLVNIAAGVVRRAIPTQQNGSHMVGVVADGSRAFTGNIGSNTVSELDLRTGAFVRMFTVPEQPEAINVTSDGKEVWVGSNALGRVSALDPATGAVVMVGDGFGFPYRVLFTPDEKTALIPDYRGEVLRFVDRATKKEISRIALPGAGPQGISMQRDGRFAYLSLSAQGKVAIIDVERRVIIGHIDVGDTPDGVAISG